MAMAIGKLWREGQMGRERWGEREKERAADACSPSDVDDII